MKEQTLVLIKPDGVQRSLIGKIIQRFEKRGLKMAAVKFLQPSKELAEQHYAATEKQLLGMGNRTLDKAREDGTLEKVKQHFGTIDPLELGDLFRKWLIEFLTSGPVVAMVVEGNNAISVVRKVCGNTDPSKADIGTIRGDFAHTDVTGWNYNKCAIRNLVHASGTPEEAKYEISLWFEPREIISYRKVDDEHIGLK